MPIVSLTTPQFRFFAFVLESLIYFFEAGLLVLSFTSVSFLFFSRFLLSFTDHWDVFNFPLWL